MPDGSTPQTLTRRPVTPTVALRPGEIAVDLFAGGGGASEAIRQALGYDPFVAINHDQWAIGMHSANHPDTRHLCEDVWEADPRTECQGHKVGLLHASPDCTHFSQAKGGQPRDRKIRSLSWVVLKWAGQVRPRTITLENVKQIRDWTRLVAKRDKATGRVVTLDMVTDPETGRKVNRVAEPGEHVPVERQFLVPDKRCLGRTWKHFVRALRGMGYDVDWFLLRASDFGAGTSRERLFMMARRDGEPIHHPALSHGAAPGQQPVVSAAECIDWTIDCPSIFSRKRPLADATCKRIARGIKRYVLDATEPFIVPNNTNNAPKPVSQPVPTITTCDGRNLLVKPVLAPFITEHANGTSQRNMAVDEPLRTQCAQVKGGHFAVVAPVLVQASHGEGNGRTKRRGSGAHDPQQPLGVVHAGGGSFALASAHLLKIRGSSNGADLQHPLPSITSGAGAKRPAGAAHAMGVITAFLEQANGGGPNGKPPRARGADEPVSSITGSGSQQRLVTAHLAKLRGTSHAADVDAPLATISAGGEHHAVVECTLSPEVEAGALRVAAFLIRYYGEGGQWGDLREPTDTVTTRDRLALVTVTIKGQPYVIVDIGLRMLKPHELFRAQGFPSDYIIDRLADGTPLTATKQVRMVGNSVSPPPLRALLEANLDPIEGAEQRLAA